LLKGEEQR